MFVDVNYLLNKVHGNKYTKRVSEFVILFYNLPPYKDKKWNVYLFYNLLLLSSLFQRFYKMYRKC